MRTLYRRALRLSEPHQSMPEYAFYMRLIAYAIVILSMLTCWIAVVMWEMDEKCPVGMICLR